MAIPERQPTEPRPEVTIRSSYANYVLFILFVVYIFNFLDRQILTILLEPIKTELGPRLLSVMTALSGLVQNFVQLALARIGVGVGEAAGSPPAHSLLADYFPPERRATALSIYSSGIYIGSMAG